MLLTGDQIIEKYYTGDWREQLLFKPSHQSFYEMWENSHGPESFSFIEYTNNVNIRLPFSNIRKIERHVKLVIKFNKDLNI